MSKNGSTGLALPAISHWRFFSPGQQVLATTTNIGFIFKISYSYASLSLSVGLAKVFSLVMVSAGAHLAVMLRGIAMVLENVWSLPSCRKMSGCRTIPPARMGSIADKIQNFCGKEHEAMNGGACVELPVICEKG